MSTKINPSPVAEVVFSVLLANSKLSVFGISIRAQVSEERIVFLSRDWAFNGGQVVRLVLVPLEEHSGVFIVSAHECIGIESFGLTSKDELYSYDHIKTMVSVFVEGWLGCEIL